MVRFFRFSGIFLLLLFSLSTLAQPGDCPTLEQAAFAESRVWCRELETGQVCYGNPGVSLIGQGDNVPVFAAPGDTIAAAEIGTLNTQIGENQYGVVLALLAAYPLNSWQTGEITVAAYGETQITNLARYNADVPMQDIEITQVDAVNIRNAPGVNNAVVASVYRGDVVKATGRLSDDTWVRLQLPNGDTGWLSSSAFDASLRGLPVVTVNDAAPAPFELPLTLFSLLTGVGDARCENAPDSGLLLQTPNITTEYRFVINGVEIFLAGTAFLQAQPEMGLVIYLLEGTARVLALNTEWIVRPGFQVTTPLINTENSLVPAAPPIVPTRYAYERLFMLPLSLLPRSTYIDFDLAAIIRPAPTDGNSPLGGVLVTDPCVLTVGVDGVNLRTGAGTDFALRGTMNFRQSARVIARTIGTDGNPWWQLAPGVWISSVVSVTGGDCAAVPVVEAPLLPTPTPESE